MVRTFFQSLNHGHPSTGKHGQTSPSACAVVTDQVTDFTFVDQCTGVSSADNDESIRLAALIENFNGPEREWVLLKEARRAIPKDTPGIDNVVANVHASLQTNVEQWTWGW